MYKILVIDDEKNILTLCKLILEKDGFFVSVAASAYIAQKELSAAKFDLAIVDCTLGLYIGDNLMEKLFSEYPDTGIIMISGYFNSEEIEMCRKKGASCCIEKPFSRNELLTAVNHYLKHKNSKTAAETTLANKI